MNVFLSLVGRPFPVIVKSSPTNAYTHHNEQNSACVTSIQRMTVSCNSSHISLYLQLLEAPTRRVDASHVTPPIERCGV